MGGGKIKDATALPSDVASGKIFYNNQGRQEGTANIKNIKTVTLIKKGSSSGSLSSFECLQFDVDEGCVTPLYHPVPSLSKYSQQNIPMNGIEGITVNGKYYDTPLKLGNYMGFLLTKGSQDFIFALKCFDGMATISPQYYADRYNVIIHYY